MQAGAWDRDSERERERIKMIFWFLTIFSTNKMEKKKNMTSYQLTVVKNTVNSSSINYNIGIIG